jgi:hypothetical protein
MQRSVTVGLALRPFPRGGILAADHDPGAAIMRRGIVLLAVAAAAGCASNDVPTAGVQQAPPANANVTGNWNASWGPLTATGHSCTATGTLVLTQGSVSYVTGTYTVYRTCDGVTDTLTGDVQNGNVGSGQIAFTLDVAKRLVQLANVTADSMVGVSQWQVTLGGGLRTLRGPFAAAKQ